MQDDGSLLLLYVEDGSEAAFRELVQRHVGFVYQSALRQSGGNDAQAADVTQIVFTHLARKARSLTHHPSLPSWLLKSTRYAVLQAIRSDRRRKKREAEAARHDDLLRDHSPEADWTQLRPALDEALCELADKDRQILLSRFFGGLTLAQVGAKLGLREDAARMRIDRALDRLRSILTRRGVSSSVVALELLLANQPAMAVPASLAAGISSVALASAPAGIGGSVTAIFLMNQKIMLPALAVMLTAGVAVFEVRQTRRFETELDAAQHSLRRQDALLARGSRNVAEGAAEIARLNAEIVRLSQIPAAPPAVTGFAEGLSVGAKLHGRYPNDVVAIVGSKAILARDVAAAISAQNLATLRASAINEQDFNYRLDQLISEAIDNLIDRELIIREFQKDKPGEDEARKIPNTYIDQQIATIEQEQFGGDHTRFLAHIQEQGISLIDYRKQVENDIIYNYMSVQLRRPVPDATSGTNETPAQRRNALLERLHSEGTVRRF